MDRESLLSKPARKTAEVPFRDTVLTVRSLYESEKVNDYESYFFNKKSEPIADRKRYIRTRLIALSVCNGSADSPLFTPDDCVAIFENWSSQEVATVYQACVDLGGDDESDLKGELGN